MKLKVTQAMNCPQFGVSICITQYFNKIDFYFSFRFHISYIRGNDFSRVDITSVMY